MRKLLLVIVVISMACAVVLEWHSLSPPQEPPSYPFQKTVRYGFTVTNTTNELIESAIFQVFAPMAETGTQKVEDITATRPYRLTVDELGNQRLEFVFENLPPFSTKTVDITARMALASVPNQTVDVVESRYLSGETYVELDSTVVRTVARQFDKAPEKPREIYDWLVSNIDYAGYIAEDRGAEYALKQRKGDCTEYMYGFLALSRLHKIPSRGIGGFVVGQHENLLGSDGYHNWAEYYSEGYWITVDPQRQVFAKPDKHYIAFRYISRGENQPMGNSHRFLAFDPRLSVRMN